MITHAADAFLVDGRRVVDVYDQHGQIIKAFDTCSTHRVNLVHPYTKKARASFLRTGTQQFEVLPDCPQVVFDWTRHIWSAQPQHVESLNRLGAGLLRPTCACVELAEAIRVGVHRWSTAISEYERKSRPGLTTWDKYLDARVDLLKELRRLTTLRRLGAADEPFIAPIELRLTDTIRRFVRGGVDRCSYPLVQLKGTRMTRTAIHVVLTREASVSWCRMPEPLFGSEFDDDGELMSTLVLGLPRGWLGRLRKHGCIHDNRLVVDERDDARLLLTERRQNFHLDWVPR